MVFKYFGGEMSLLGSGKILNFMAITQGLCHNNGTERRNAGLILRFEGD
jgi:hypothetical protein